MINKSPRKGSKIFKFILPALLLLSPMVFASDDLEQRAKDPTWLSLGSYKKNWLGNLRSDISSPQFFLAKDGRNDPLAELAATIESFSKPVTENPDDHAQCRFPARLRWLSKKGLVKIETLPNVQCAGFQRFSHQNQVESISLIFATGFLSNPASFFGHPLLKFNLPRTKVPSNLMDVSVNYGAMTPPDENTFVYAAKGLFGGYFATFSNREFYSNTHAYGEVELRDMWEYQLNLTPDEVQDTVARTWEMIGKFFPYYFFTDNCASAMAELVTDVTGTPLSSDYMPYALPYNLFDNLTSQKKPDGSSLVSKITLLPSRQSRLTSRYRTLSQKQKVALRTVIDSATLTDSFKSLPADERGTVTETLFDYYSFRATADSKPEEFSGVRRMLLLNRLQDPPSTQADVLTYDLKPPHEGQRPLLTRIGGFHSREFGQGLELQFRTSYYDQLSLDYGRAKNSEVRTLDTVIDVAKDEVWLRSLSIFAIETLNLSQTGLPGDGGSAWKFEFGFDSADPTRRDSQVFKVEAGIGQSLALQDDGALTFMIDGRVQSEYAELGSFALTPHLDLLFDPLSSELWRTAVSIGYRQHMGRIPKGEALVRWENRWGGARTWDIRSSVEKDVDERAVVSYSRYW